MRLRFWLAWVWQQEGTPGQRALGLALGIFSGCFPLFGLQSVLAIILASLFRGNRLLAIIGTWISNPFTYVPLYWFNYQLGCYFLGSGEGLLDFKKLTLGTFLESGWIFISRLLLGSSLVGCVLGIIAGVIIYAFIKDGPRNRQ